MAYEPKTPVSNRFAEAGGSGSQSPYCRLDNISKLFTLLEDKCPLSTSGSALPQRQRSCSRRAPRFLKSYRITTSPLKRCQVCIANYDSHKMRYRLIKCNSRLCGGTCKWWLRVNTCLETKRSEIARVELMYPSSMIQCEDS